MSWRNGRRRFGGAAAAVVLGLSFGVATGAAPAQAADCGWSPPFNGDGYAIMTAHQVLESGPYASCANLTASAGVGVKVWIHCRQFNTYDNLWWYVRIAGTDHKGWLFNGNMNVTLKDDGDGTPYYPNCTTGQNT
jgi:hypothetical protein